MQIFCGSCRALLDGSDPIRYEGAFCPHCGGFLDQRNLRLEKKALPVVTGPKLSSPPPMAALTTLEKKPFIPSEPN